MTQTPGSATLDQTLRFLALLAQSDAYATELQALVSATNPTAKEVLRYAVVDANGQQRMLDLVDTDYADLSWISPTLKRVQTTDGLRIEPPFPRLMIIGQPGEMIRDAQGGEFRADAAAIVGYAYLIDCIVLTSNGDPNAASREALLHAEALDRLVQRNEQLGGLVRLIGSDGPGTPATAEWRGKGTVGAGASASARCRLPATMTAIISKPGSLNVSRRNCFILVARDMRPGRDHGSWQPLSVMGFSLIFASKKDAMEFRLVYGGSQYPVHARMSDDAYEAYLEQFVRIQPYEATGKWEVWGHNAMRGWVPEVAEILTGRSDSQYDLKVVPSRVSVFDSRRAG